MHSGHLAPSSELEAWWLPGESSPLGSSLFSSCEGSGASSHGTEQPFVLLGCDRALENKKALSDREDGFFRELCHTGVSAQQTYSGPLCQVWF